MTSLPDEAPAAISMSPISTPESVATDALWANQAPWHLNASAMRTPQNGGALEAQIPTASITPGTAAPALEAYTPWADTTTPAMTVVSPLPKAQPNAPVVPIPGLDPTLGPMSAVAMRATAEGTGAPVSSSPASEQPAEATAEPRQGVIILDGAQLGRWIVDHLETLASRPGSAITGIDPRMNAIYPGAPLDA
jgi:hypothetical protein